MGKLLRQRCTCCGHDFGAANIVNGVVTCDYCGSLFTVANSTDDRVLNFLDAAEHDLDTCRFDEALSAYKKAAELDGNEPEAYFGMALAKFKVQFLRDEVNNRLQPICHETEDKKFTDDPDYMRACLKATPAQRAVYESKAKEIDYIQSEFLKLKKSGLNYDCFICVKVTGDDGSKTEDSKDADYIYHLLKDKGYRPFYSEYEIRNKQGADYEAHILYALYSSECMLVICRDEEYLQTKWVKNEYARFLKLVNDEEKESDSVTLVFNGKPIEKLPGKHGKIQGIDFALRSADGQIVNFVESHTPAARKKREEAQKAKERAEAEFGEQRRKLEEQQRQIAEQLEKLKTTGQGNISYEELAKTIEKERLKREEEGALTREEQQRIAAEYEISGNILVRYKGKATDVKIPKIVTSIADEAFRENNTIKSVTIPAGVTEIGERAFCDCKNLASVTLTADVTKIGPYAFSGCGRLAKLPLMEGLLTIEKGAFFNCGCYESLVIPDSVTSIGWCSFSGCHISEVALGSGLTQVGEYAFSACENLKTVKLGRNVTEIGEHAFYSCPALTNIKFNNGLTKIGDCAFSECKNLTQIELPDSVTEIGFAAFCNAQIMTANFGQGLKIIGEAAFCGCYMRGLFIPKSVEEIGARAFEACKGIDQVGIREGVKVMGKQVFKDCENVFVYCAAKKKPDGWNKDWDLTKDGGMFSKKRVGVKWNCP